MTKVSRQSRSQNFDTLQQRLYKILFLTLILLWTSDFVYADEIIVSQRISKALDSSRRLTERTVDTRATLKMDQLKNLDKNSQSTELWWVFALEEFGDRVTTLYSLPDPPNRTSWGISIVALYEKDRITVVSSGAPGLYALQRFQDVANNLGVGSHIKFAPEQWVDFYNEKFRKGGFSISTNGLKFLEGTEVLINDEVWVLRGDSWVSSKPVKSKKVGPGTKGKR